MKSRIDVSIFEDHEVRFVRSNGERWIPAIDIAVALGYPHSRRAVSDILRNNIDRFKGYAKIVHLESEGGKQRTTVLNLHGAIAFCLLSKQPKAIPFQRWADGVIADALTKESIRVKSKQIRNEFTGTLKSHGCSKPHHYIDITLAMKDGLSIDRKKKKDEYDKIELLKTTASEAVAQINIIQNNADGHRECKDISVKSSETIQNATRAVING